MIPSLDVLGSGFAGTAIGIALPILFNRYLLPLVSKNARLRKYLMVLHTAAQAYQEEFPDAFNNPDVQWDDYAGKVLQYAIATNPMPPSDKVWLLAQKVFLNSGFVMPSKVGSL